MLANFCPRRMLIILIIQDSFLLITCQNGRVPPGLSHHTEFLDNTHVNITLLSFLNNFLAMFLFLVLFGSLPNPKFPPRTMGRSFKEYFPIYAVCFVSLFV